MKIICLFAQRKCNYDGQYAPELISAADEITNQDNPDYLLDAEDEIKSDSSIDYYKWIEIIVSEKDFDEVFRRKEQVKGSVIEVTE